MTTESKEFDLGLDILDRQLLDNEGFPCGKVDDVMLEFPNDDLGQPPRVTHILVNMEALAPRIRGKVGEILLAFWRRLHPNRDPQPIELEWAYVAKVDTDVHLNVRRDEAGLTQSEDWARTTIIERIPGAK